MKTTRSAVGRLFAVVGLALVAFMSTGAAALPDMSATQRVIADFELDAGEHDAIREAAVAANALVFVSGDVSVYGDTDLVLKEVERRWVQDTKHAPKVLVVDLATNTLWTSASDTPTYCAADASTAECVSGVDDGPKIAEVTAMVFLGLLGLAVLVFFFLCIF